MGLCCMSTSGVDLDVKAKKHPGQMGASKIQQANPNKIIEPKSKKTQQNKTAVELKKEKFSPSVNLGSECHWYHRQHNKYKKNEEDE